MTALSLTKRTIQGIEIEWEIVKNCYAFIFFFLQIYQVSCMSSFYKDHAGNFDTWLSLEEEKFKTIYLSEYKSVRLKRNAKRHLKLTKKFWSWKLFPLYYVYLKVWSLSPFLTNKVLFVNRWPHSVDTPKGGVERKWGTRLSSHVITVWPHEPGPPRQSFETNLEISQSQVEIETMKLCIILFRANSK